MSGVMAAWVVGAALLTWTQGLNPNRQGGPQFPPPFIYLDLTMFIAVCALISRANGTVGGLLAWGFLLALMLRNQVSGQPTSVFQDINNAVQALWGPSSAAAQHAAGTGP